jgi:ribosomal protein S18 acetylase RimI-like enzyme
MVTIRKARLADVEEIVQLWKEFFDKLDDKVVSGNPLLRYYVAKKVNADQIFKDFAKKTIRSKNGIVLVAEVDSKLAGYALSYIKKNISVFRVERYGYISDLYVKKEYRKKGISTLLKKETIKWFRQKGLKHASLMVHSGNNRAHGIYKKWGFQKLHIEMRRKI